jgi:hypothetical protein
MNITVIITTSNNKACVGLTAIADNDILLRNLSNKKSKGCYKTIYYGVMV